MATDASLLVFLAGSGRNFGLIETIEGNLALLVNFKNANLHFVSDGKNVLNFLNATLRNTRNVEQAIFTGQKLNEGTKRYIPRLLQEP